MLGQIPKTFKESRTEPIRTWASITIHAKDSQLNFVRIKGANEGLSLVGVNGRANKERVQVEGKRRAPPGSEKIFVEIKEDFFLSKDD